MICFETAEKVSVQDLKDYILNDDHGQNITVDGMFFIETKGKDGEPGKVFPCYIYAFTEVDDEEKGGKTAVFQADILQFHGGEFDMVKVYLAEKDFDISKRIWDRPPTKGLREYHPWLEETVQ